MIKAILFDYGGVMTDGGGGSELSDRLGAGLGISSKAAFAMLGPVWNQYASGTITEDELWQAIEADYGKPIEPAERAIWNTWKDHMQPRAEMVELVKGLQAQGYTVGLLSNVIPNTAADIRANGGYDAFDFLVLSCEAGYSKPAREIYECALEQLQGFKPEEVLFIDDQERFLVPARALGMHTILAQNATQIAAEVKKLLAKS
jgi:epoxide hydrolase-like predicted phosphatase